MAKYGRLNEHPCPCPLSPSSRLLVHELFLLTLSIVSLAEARATPSARCTSDPSCCVVYDVCPSPDTLACGLSYWLSYSLPNAPTSPQNCELSVSCCSMHEASPKSNHIKYARGLHTRVPTPLHGINTASCHQAFCSRVLNYIHPLFSTR